MLHLILAAIARGDGVLVLDVKGDMTAGLPGEPLLIAPQDRRSLVWDVARDCRTKQDARELAARLIPKSDDPMWSDAARDMLVVCVAALQATRGERWSWSDLHAIATSDAETLLRLAKAHHVDAVRLLETPDSRTTQSVLSTFQAHMHVVATLADAWRASTNGGFSISDWLKKPTPFRPVILQHDGRYPELSNAWIGGMLALLASAVGSPSLAESRERRIWIFADEFPQLPRLGHFSTFLDLGRSKGVITVIGAQDIAQLRATYGHERADAWVGMIGTKIITRINAGRGAEEASALIGDQEIERVEHSETRGRRPIERDDNASPRDPARRDSIGDRDAARPSPRWHQRTAARTGRRRARAVGALRDAAATPTGPCAGALVSRIASDRGTHGQAREAMRRDAAVEGRGEAHPRDRGVSSSHGCIDLGARWC